LKNKRLENYALIAGLAVAALGVATTWTLATHTRVGALCVMILKALDLVDVFLVASVGVLAGTTTAVFALLCLLSRPKEEDRLSEEERQAEENREENRLGNICENKNDEN